MSIPRWLTITSSTSSWTASSLAYTRPWHITKTSVLTHPNEKRNFSTWTSSLLSFRRRNKIPKVKVRGRRVVWMRDCSWEKEKCEVRRRRVSSFLKKYRTNEKWTEGLWSVREAIIRHGIAKLYREQKHLHPLAMQTRNQSRRRGSLTGDTSRSRSLVQKRIKETSKEYIIRRRTYSSTLPPLDSQIASHRGRGRRSCRHWSKCFSSRIASSMQIGNLKKCEKSQS